MCDPWFVTYCNDKMHYEPWWNKCGGHLGTGPSALGDGDIDTTQRWVMDH